MPLTRLTDEELMARYQLGSEEAFSMLYQRHATKVFGFIKRRVSQPESASELFQEVFVKMHKSKHLYSSTLPFLPWLFSISRSVLLDSIRADKRRPQINVEIDSSELAADVPSRGQSSNAEALDPHLIGLPASQRSAVQLRYVDDKTFDEIASILNTSPVNARKLISRGVATLKSLISEEKSHERRKK